MWIWFYTHTQSKLEKQRHRVNGIWWLMIVYMRNSQAPDCLHYSNLDQLMLHQWYWAPIIYKYTKSYLTTDLWKERLLLLDLLTKTKQLSFWCFTGSIKVLIKAYLCKFSKQIYSNWKKLIYIVNITISHLKSTVG